MEKNAPTWYDIDILSFDNKRLVMKLCELSWEIKTKESILKCYQNVKRLL